MILILAYKAFLDLVFYYFVNPAFGSEVYFSNFIGSNLCNFICSYFMVMVFWFFFGKVRGRASRFFLTFQFLIFIVPFCVLFGQLKYPFYFLVPITFGYVTLALLLMYLPSIKICNMSGKFKNLCITLLVLLVWYVVINLLVRVGYKNINFNLLDVYEFRDRNSSVSFFGSSLISSVAYIFNVGLLIYFLQLKQSSGNFVYFLLAILSVVFQVLIFGLTNYKAFLFIMPASLGIMYLMRFNGDLKKTIMLGVVSIVCISILLSQATGLYSLSMIRRAFFVPAALPALYYEYFSTYDFTGVHSMNMVFGYISNELDNIRQIAFFYWGRNFSPNVEWVTDAYTKLGLVYVFINSVVIASILKFADSICSQLDIEKGVPEALLLGPCMVLSSSGLVTAIATHGLIFAVPMIWILSRTRLSGVSD
jgi:hypothetical protein